MVLSRMRGEAGLVAGGIDMKDYHLEYLNVYSVVIANYQKDPHEFCTKVVAHSKAEAIRKAERGSGGKAISCKLV